MTKLKQWAKPQEGFTDLSRTQLYAVAVTIKKRAGIDTVPLPKGAVGAMPVFASEEQVAAFLREVGIDEAPVIEVPTLDSARAMDGKTIFPKTARRGH